MVKRGRREREETEMGIGEDETSEGGSVSFCKFEELSFPESSFARTLGRSFVHVHFGD